MAEKKKKKYVCAGSSGEERKRARGWMEKTPRETRHFHFFSISLRLSIPRFLVLHVFRDGEEEEEQTKKKEEDGAA